MLSSITKVLIRIVLYLVGAFLVDIVLYTSLMVIQLTLKVKESSSSNRYVTLSVFQGLFILIIGCFTEKKVGLSFCQ